MEIEKQKTLAKPKVCSTVQQAAALPFLRHIWIPRPLRVERYRHTKSSGDAGETEVKHHFLARIYLLHSSKIF